VTGCRKYFHRHLGYQSENYLPRHPQVSAEGIKSLIRS
jgi:hypothetical protein